MNHFKRKLLTMGMSIAFLGNFADAVSKTTLRLHIAPTFSLSKIKHKAQAQIQQRSSSNIDFFAGSNATFNPATGLRLSTGVQHANILIEISGAAFYKTNPQNTVLHYTASSERQNNREEKQAITLEKPKGLEYSVGLLLGWRFGHFIPFARLSGGWQTKDRVNLTEPAITTYASDEEGKFHPQTIPGKTFLFSKTQRPIYIMPSLGIIWCVTPKLEVGVEGGVKILCHETSAYDYIRKLGPDNTQKRFFHIQEKQHAFSVMTHLSWHFF